MSGVFVGFGEAMMRFAPQEGAKPDPSNPYAEAYIRSIGGDELNVCVDLAKLGTPSRWVFFLFFLFGWVLVVVVVAAAAAAVISLLLCIFFIESIVSCLLFLV